MFGKSEESSGMFGKSKDKLKEKQQKLADESREVAPGVWIRRKASQKFLEDLINSGNPVWIWIERISHLVTPTLVLFLIFRVMALG